MPVLRSVLQCSLAAVFGALCLGVFVWIWHTPAPAPDPDPDPQFTKFVSSNGQERRRPFQPQRGAVAVVEEGSGPSDGVHPWAQLKPGMTRTEVESLVGTPQPQHTHPAVVENGTVTYRTTYETDLELPPTVRPIRVPRVEVPAPLTKARTLITLEFDATKRGHTLCGMTTRVF